MPYRGSLYKREWGSGEVAEVTGSHVMQRSWRAQQVHGRDREQEHWQESKGERSWGEGFLQWEIADLRDVFFPMFLKGIPKGVGVVVMREEQSVTGENIKVELRDVQKPRYKGRMNEQISYYKCKD